MVFTRPCRPMHFHMIIIWLLLFFHQLDNANIYMCIYFEQIINGDTFQRSKLADVQYRVIAVETDRQIYV